jgi:hypothetical protein
MDVAVFIDYPVLCQICKCRIATVFNMMHTTSLHERSAVDKPKNMRFPLSNKSAYTFIHLYPTVSIFQHSDFVREGFVEYVRTFTVRQIGHMAMAAETRS